MLVSVIIPTYNRREYVCQAIDSALNQTHPDVEVIVVDDGSTDGTGDALRARYGDQIEYLYQQNQGEAAARNRAIAESSGQYVALLDSDDAWRPTKLAQQMAFMQPRPAVGLVGCHALAIDVQGNRVHDRPVYPGYVGEILSLETLVLRSPLYCSTVMMRRACLDQVGLFCEDIRYGEDRELFLRIAAKYPVGFVGEPLALLRRHSGAQSRPLVSKAGAERRANERLWIVERAFSVFEGDRSEMEGLKARALAREYARAAIPDYVYGEHARGTARLAKAVELDPGTWGDGKDVAELVLGHAAALGREVGAHEAVAFVRQTYAHLPDQIGHWRGRFERRILGRLHVELAFLYHQRGETCRVLPHVVRGVIGDPRWLRNVGLLSIATQSLTGLSISQFALVLMGLVTGSVIAVRLLTEKER